MKGKISLLIILAYSLGFGDSLPKYLNTVRGTLISTITQRDVFEFNPGEIVSCTKKSVVEWLTFECSIKGTSAAVTTEKGSTLVEFSKLFVFFKPDSKTGEVLREYDFHGTWRERGAHVELNSKTLLRLWYYDNNPSSVKGDLELVDYNKFSAIEAVQ